ncbi:MAG: molybdenum ABC transporter ATP-binding protein [bacterium]
MNIELDISLGRPSFRLDVTCDLAEPVTGVFGPSGAGKTTLLHLIAGLIRPTRGRIAVAGTTLVDTDAGVWVPPYRRHVGVVFQEGRLFPHRSVRGNLRYGERLVPAGERRVHLDDVLDLLEIRPLLGRAPADLSGGEQQRVALGRALLMSPKLLLLDEPVAGVDIGLRRQILPFVRRVRTRLDIPMLMVSHDLPDLLRLTRNLLLLDRGRLAGCGAYFDLVEHKHLLGLVRGTGLVNVMSCVLNERLEGAGLALLEPVDTAADRAVVFRSALRPEDRPGTHVSVLLSAEDISIALGPVEDISIRNQLPGRIESIVEHPNGRVCIVDAGVKLLVEITPQAARTMRLRQGTEVLCLFKARAVHVLPEN